MKSKFLATLISIVMVTTFVPTVSFAAEDYSGKIESVNNETEEAESLDSKSIIVERDKLDERSISTFPISDLEKIENNDGQIVVKSAASPIYYIIKNVRSASDYTGSDIATATGDLA